MTDPATFSRVFGLLAQLCERYEELPAVAHVAVMEAFNRFAESVPSHWVVAPPSSDLSIQDLIALTLGAIDDLSSAASELRSCLLYAETRQLIQIAASES